jgi:5-hydroxyisourate hydrolase
MPRISTHVLDTARGIPARGIPVSLCRLRGDERLFVGSAVTNADGRTDAPLVSAEALETGVYELSFHASDYFHRIGMTQPAQPFLGVIVIRVGIADPSGNYHVPLLLSPFAYSTYRGS